MIKELYNGDCLEILKENPQLLERADLILADPPYGMLNKKASWDLIIDPQEMWRLINEHTKDTTPTVLFCMPPFSYLVIANNVKNFKYKYYWEKTQATGFLNAKKQPLRNIEEIAVFYKKQPTYNPQMWKSDKLSHANVKRTNVANNTKVYGDTLSDNVYEPTYDRYPTQVLKFKSDKQLTSLHPTQKPVPLLENLIKTFTNEGDTVLDFCMGSGSTGEAALKNGRNFIGIEKDENYYQICLDRLKDFC